MSVRRLVSLLRPRDELRVGREVRVDETVRIFGRDRVRLGSNIRIDAYAVISAGQGGVEIGDNVHVGAHVFIAGAERIEIASFANISGRVSIYSSNDDYSGHASTGPMVPPETRGVTNAPVTVGPYSIIGSGSVLLPGVTLGEGAAVGALSLVKQSVDPFDIVAGVPARSIGTRSRKLLEHEAEPNS